MDELPELPFEKVLSYLNLRDLLQSRAVSRGWYHRINCRKVKSLCCSNHPSDFVLGKSRWIRGAYAQNFISSLRIDRFVDKFASTILSDLKRLRLCDLSLNDENMPEYLFFQMLNSFVQLEELDIIQFGRHSTRKPKIVIDLNLPMLRSIHVEDVCGVEKVTLETPRLQRVELRGSLTLELVHGESVERLLLYDLDSTEVKNMKNLKELHVGDFSEIDPTLLSSLEQLKELYLHQSNLYESNDPSQISQLFQQKRRYGRTDLKIYLFGCLLNSPDDPAIRSLSTESGEELLVYLAENPSRLTEEIPFWEILHYSNVQGIATELAVNLMKRLTSLKEIVISRIENVESFLNLLKSLDHLVKLEVDDDQPQELFDRLPEHCNIQKLEIRCAPSDFRFLSRLRGLTHLYLYCTVDVESIPQFLEVLELPYLSKFLFKLPEWVEISIGYPRKRFEVYVNGEREEVAEPNAAIQFIIEKARELAEKRKQIGKEEESIE